mmetsp:Transcript_7747/g.10684  ORF Transcript_7747/g.10684 Transcript_7747/m.10684 type:complete len:87 (-) Transcript_7747:32-292(-)
MILVLWCVFYIVCNSFSSCQTIEPSQEPSKLPSILPSIKSTLTPSISSHPSKSAEPSIGLTISNAYEWNRIYPQGCSCVISGAKKN